MKQKWVAMLIAVVLTISLAACGAKEETTLTGIVVSVDGTVIQLVEMDAGGMGGMNVAQGERPEIPAGENFPQWGGGEMPEDGRFPQWGDGEMPEMPEGMTPPEGMTMPDMGEMPDFGGENGGSRPGFGSFDTDAETKNVDIGDAHISVEIDGGKASGSMDDIQVGAFVTITMNGKGQVTNVLVSSQSFLSGGRRSVN